MVWIVGNNPKTVQTDWNAHMRSFQSDEISEDQARVALGQFLQYNIGFTVWIMTGYLLEPDQRIVLKGWLKKNFSLCVASRGYAKSYLAGHFSYLYALTHREQHILIVSATFRSSRRILEEIDRMAHRKRVESPDGRVLPGGELLLETFDRKLEKKPDMYKIWFKNGSTITAVPLGDPDNLRGFRCNTLIIDEGLMIPQYTIESVLKPFLTGEAQLTKKQLIQREEKKKIAAGEMREEDRKRFPSTAKMIMLSSASYRWEELYTHVYRKYLDIISPDTNNPDKPAREQTDDGDEPSYLVQQLSYKLAENRMDKAVLKQIRDKMIPEPTIKREYEAQFIDESGGYFSAKEMMFCTVEPGQRPCPEIVGEKGAEYILGIDPSISSDDGADHFAMCVIKVINRPKDGRKVGLVVHQYGCCGVEPKHHIGYLHYVIERFRPVYIVVDTTQGDNLDFISICNESEHFKRYRLELNPIQADFTGESFDEMVKQVARSYNPDSSVKRIVHKQFWTAPFIRAANEYLRAAFDQRLLYFPSHAQSVGEMVVQMCEQDVLNIHRSHPEYADDVDTGQSSMYEFVTYQDNMIEVVKKQISLIEATPNRMGTLGFDLPHSLTRNRRDAKRQRKDNYSALLMANWGLKTYLATQDVPANGPDDSLFNPMWV